MPIVLIRFFNGELGFLFPPEVLRIARPCGDWPAGTLDTLRLFEDKSCWTIPLETRRQTAQALFQKVKP